MGPALIFVVFIAIAAAIAYFSFQAKKKRRLAFAAMAKQLAFQYAINDPFNTLAEPFALFGKGDGRGVENVLWGTWNGMEARVFDYWYYEESTDSKGDRTRSYSRFDCVLAPIEAACAHLIIDHENLFTRIADHLSFHDIEFESEDFNKRYNIKCSDKKFANDFIDARMIDFLMQHGEGFAFEVAADRLLAAYKKVQPNQIIPLMGTMKAFRDEVPKVVFSLYPKAG
jgi:hypothetical protein